jgi:integrase
MAALRAIYNYALDRDETLPPNPVRLRKEWFNVAPRERFLNGDQLPVFYTALGDLENKIQADFLRVVLFTGLRRASAAALRWEQVDFASRVIRLPAKQLKGGKRRLDLPMTDYLRDLLVARRVLGDDGGWVFPADSESGHLEEPAFALGEVAKATAIAGARAAGVKIDDDDDVPQGVIDKYGVAVSCHDLRRTFITVAESTDISPLALKALVNHAVGGDVTANYVRLTVERLREPAQRVANQLKQLCGIAKPAGENVERIGGRA